MHVSVVTFKADVTIVRNTESGGVIKAKQGSVNMSLVMSEWSVR